MTYLILIIMSLLDLTAYIVSCVCFCGVPTSISATYYNTQHKWMLPLVLGISLATAIVPFFDLTPDYLRFLVFITVAGLMFVASAPAFRKEFEGKVHCVAAITAGASSVAWLSIIGGVPWLAIAGLLTAIVNWKNKTFWIEVGILLNLYIVLIRLAI